MVPKKFLLKPGKCLLPFDIDDRANDTDSVVFQCVYDSFSEEYMHVTFLIGEQLCKFSY